VASYYVDTSALVKRYAQERGSSWIEALLTPHRQDLYTVRITAVEMIAALARKARTGGTTPADASRGMRDFRQDWPHDYLILEVTPQVTDRAMDLAEAHGLRGYDAVHLGAALALQDERRAHGLPTLTFISADDQQRRAAAAEGLSVEDPNAHP